MCWWDVRKGGNPEGVIGLEHSHLDPVYKTIWMNAKTGTEFFTGSTDGTVSDKQTVLVYKKSGVKKDTGARCRLREFKANIALIFACVGGTQPLCKHKILQTCIKDL